jgi:hypothetical protein
MADVNNDIISLLDTIIAQYSPTGEFAKSRGEQLSEKRRTGIPQMQANLASRGLSNTTIGAAIPAQFEAEVARPFETETELLRTGALSQAAAAKAGYLSEAERLALQKSQFEQEMAQREKLAGLSAAAQVHGGGGGGGGGGGSTGFMESKAGSDSFDSMFGGNGGSTFGGGTSGGGGLPGINYGDDGGGSSFALPKGITMGGKTYANSNLANAAQKYGDISDIAGRLTFNPDGSIAMPPGYPSVAAWIQHLRGV